MTNTRRVITFSLAVLLLVMTLTGCGSKDASPDQSGDPITITDQKDRVIAFEKAPQTIVCLAPNITEIVFALGLGDRVIAVTDNSNYPAEALEKEKVGNFFEPNVEKIIALSPDVVFASALVKEPVDQLENAGLKVVVLDPTSIDEIFEAMLLVGEVAQVKDHATERVNKLRGELEAIEEQVAGIPDDERPVVYYEVWHEGFMTAGPGTFINSIIEKAGGINLAADAEAAYPNYSEEAILAKDPDVIILGHSGQSVDDIKARTNWSNVSAVKNGRVYALDPDIFSRPGPRIIEAVRQLAQLLHPELFSK